MPSPKSTIPDELLGAALRWELLRQGYYKLHRQPERAADAQRRVEILMARLEEQ